MEFKTLNSFPALVLLLIILNLKLVKNEYQDAMQIGKEGADYFYYPSQIDPEASIRVFINKDFVDDEVKETVLDQMYSDNYDDIKLYLYTRDPNAPHELIPGNQTNLEGSDFIKGAPVKILIHGLFSKYTNPFPQNIKNRYIDFYKEINIIAVDWSPYVKHLWLYDKAVQINSYKVGRRIGELVDTLVTQGYSSFDKIHIIGHSLGAHVAAHSAGAIYPNKFFRITGLDPAAPGYTDNPDRLNQTCANLVDVIHTSTNFYGLSDPIGSHDFYPNGGSSQPGCSFFQKACSHSRSHEYYLESIGDEADNFWFASCKCRDRDLLSKVYEPHEDLHKFKKGGCDCKTKLPMGERLADGNWEHGIFFLITNGRSPFAKEMVMLAQPKHNEL